MLKRKSVTLAVVLVATITLVTKRCDATAPNEQSPQSASLFFILKPLGHNVYAAIDDAKDEAGANAGFVIGDDGVAIIDTFENPEASKQMLSQIRKLTELPIKFVINTHYHIDHVAGNSLFQQNGAVVFAHRNVRAWIHTENLKFFDKNIKPE
jgi:cyclase